jgi:hypothetical protein
MKILIFAGLLMVPVISSAVNTELEIFTCHYQAQAPIGKPGTATLLYDGGRLLQKVDGGFIGGEIKVGPIVALSAEEKAELEDQATKLPSGAFGFDVKSVASWQLIVGNNEAYPVGFIKAYGKDARGNDVFLGWIRLAVGFFVPCHPSR